MVVNGLTEITILTVTKIPMLSNSWTECIIPNKVFKALVYFWVTYMSISMIYGSTDRKQIHRKHFEYTPQLVCILSSVKQKFWETLPLKF